MEMTRANGPRISMIITARRILGISVRNVDSLCTLSAANVPVVAILVMGKPTPRGPVDNIFVDSALPTPGIVEVLPISWPSSLESSCPRQAILMVGHWTELHMSSDFNWAG